MPDHLHAIPKPSGRTFVIGISTTLGRSLAVRACLNGHNLIIADEDLSAADRLAEWMRSMGSSVIVESSHIGVHLVRDLHHHLDCVVDARLIVNETEDSVLEMAIGCARTIDRGGAYVRLHSGLMGCSLRSGFLDAANIGAARGVGSVVLQATDEEAFDGDRAATLAFAALSQPFTGLIDIRLTGSFERRFEGPP